MLVAVGPRFQASKTARNCPELQRGTTELHRTREKPCFWPSGLSSGPRDHRIARNCPELQRGATELPVDECRRTRRIRRDRQRGRGVSRQRRTDPDAGRAERQRPDENTRHRLDKSPRPAASPTHAVPLLSLAHGPPVWPAPRISIVEAHPASVPMRCQRPRRLTFPPGAPSRHSR